MYQPEQDERTHLSLESYQLRFLMNSICVCVSVCVSVCVQQNYSKSPTGNLAHGDVFGNGIPKEKSE